MTLPSLAAALLMAVGAGGAWLAGANNLASTLGIIAALVVIVSLVVTIATRITLGVLTTRDPQLKNALRRFEGLSSMARTVRPNRATRS